MRTPLSLWHSSIKQNDVYFVAPEGMFDIINEQVTNKLYYTQMLDYIHGHPNIFQVVLCSFNLDTAPELRWVKIECKKFQNGLIGNGWEFHPSQQE